MLGANEGQTPPEWLDKNLVTSAFRKADGDQGLVVEAQAVRHVCGVGTHFLSEMLRVTATVKRASGEREQRAIIVKSLCQAGPMRMLVQDAHMFLKETLVYTVLLPAAEAALKGAESIEWRPLTARCHDTGSQPTDFLVLEDLAETGFTMPPRGQLLDRQHCALVLKAVARLHAASLLVADHEPFAAACFSQHPMLNKSGKGHMALVADKLYSAWADILDEHPGYEKFAAKYRETKADITDKLVDAFSTCRSRLRVLLHADLWKNNTMFKYADGSPVDVRLVDFQNCFWNSPAVDIQHLLGTSASLDVHQHHVDSLVSEYHGELQATLRAMGFQQQADAFPLEQLRREMDHFALHALCMASISVPMMLAPEAGGKDAAEAMNLMQSDDTILKQMLNKPDIISHIKYVLPVYESLGAI